MDTDGTTPEVLTAREFQQAGGTEDFRVLGNGAAAWYAATSHADGARLAPRLVTIAGDLSTGLPLNLDVRPDGALVRLPLTPEDGGFTRAHVDLARAVAGAAADLGLAADPTGLQDVQLAFDVLDPGAVRTFWARALGYVPVGEEDLMDPGRRMPPIWLQDQDPADPRPLRNRLHLDSVRPVDQARDALAEVASTARSVLDHGYYATVTDPEGNEVDLLPLQDGADRWDHPGTDDWRLVFAAMACYRTPDTQDAGALIEGVAGLADAVGLPIGISWRPGTVTVATAKDAPDIDPGNVALAARVQALARELGLSADTRAPRFVQVVIDAVDIAAVRRFWAAALGYAPDPREGVTDIVDPRFLTMPLVVQGLDAADTERRRQRNRIHVDVFLPDDQLAARLAAALAAGGTVVRDAAPIWWTVADPEGNEVDLTTSAGREEHWAATRSDS